MQRWGVVNLFIAADPVKGLEILQSVDINYSITGGKVALWSSGQSVVLGRS